MSDECKEFRTAVIQDSYVALYFLLTDSIVVAFFASTLIARWVCVSCREFVCNLHNWFDIVATTIDVALTVIIYQPNDLSLLWWLFAMRYFRVAMLVILWTRIRMFKSEPWILRTVTVKVNRESGEVELAVSGHEKSGIGGKGICRFIQEFDKERVFHLSYVIDHRVDATNFDYDTKSWIAIRDSKPARTLKRIDHIVNMQNQSNYCLCIPVKATADSRHRLYLQLDAASEAVRDVWIQTLNVMYRATDKGLQTGFVPRRDRLQARHAIEEFSAPTPDCFVKTSTDHTREFGLAEKDRVLGDDNIYIWEATASGSVCCVKISEAKDEEAGRGSIGVQVRNLRDLVDEYDGEIVIVKVGRA